MKIANYKGRAVGSKEYKKATEEEINAQLTKLQESKTTYEAKEGKAENKDTVNIDYKGLLDGVAFEGGTAEKYDLVLGSNTFIPGFEEQLVGHAAGEDVDVNVTFPEQYQAENLAGKAVVFKCHIHEVKSKFTPALDDELAKSFGMPDFATMKEELTRQMNVQKKNDAENEYLNKLMAEVLKESEIDTPEDMVKSRIDEMTDYYENQVAQYGLDLNSFLSMQGLTPEQFADQISRQAVESVKGDVLLAEIAKAENISTTEEELMAELENYKKYYNIDDEKFAKFLAEHKEDAKNDIIKRKTAVFLIDNNN